MENNCLNCNHPITENFCGNCGQKKYKRIDRKYLIDEVQYMVVHTNKGFFYSLKSILKNPGKTAKDFINGNRINHYKPLLLAFVVSGISAFLSFKILKLDVIMEQHMQQTYGDQIKNAMPWMHDMMSLLSTYSSAAMLLLIPLASIVTALVFKKWGDNYYEHVIMNTYILIYYTVVSIIVLFPILYLLNHISSSFAVVFSTLSIFLVYPLIMVLFYKQYYSQKSMFNIILKVLLALGIGLVIYMMIIFGMIINMVITHPEMFMPKKP